MKIGDMVRDISSPVTSRHRKEDFIRQLNQLGDRDEKYRTWLRFADSRINASALSADPFMHSTYLMRFDTQSVPHDTETTIAWDSVRALGGAVNWRLSDPTKLTRPRGPGLLGVMGKLQWQANATGFRSASMNMYDQSGTQLYGETFHTLPAGVAASVTTPFASGLWFVENSPAYLTFTVIQTSGGALDLQFATLAVFVMDYFSGPSGAGA